LHLSERLEAVTRQRTRRWAPSSQIVCVLYASRLEQVMEDLSRELPPYRWLDAGANQDRMERVH
jgi:hypothetical protein